MKRRRYVAVAATLSIGGCLGTGGDAGGNETADGTSDFDADVDPVAVEAGTYDDFEALEEWLVAGGSLEADGERAVSGSQSGRLTASETADRVSAVYAPSQPLDVTGYAPGLAVAADRDLVLRLRLHDAAGDFVEYRTRVVGGLPFDRRQFGIDRLVGEPSIDEVRRIEILRHTGDGPSELWIDDLHFVPRPDPGAVMIHFDGGYETDYTRALPILAEHDVPATTFVTPDRLRTDPRHEGDRLTTAQVETLADAGWTIGSHAARGLALTDVADARADVDGAVRWLAANGYGEGARYFSYPAGQYDAASYGLAAEYHDLAFAGGGVAHGHVTDPHRIPRVVHPDAETARDAIDQTVARGGITSFVFHELDADSEAVLADLVDRVVDRESAGDLSIVTPADLAAEYRYRPDQ
ncbi:polysaccharide deacetylase family protein [Halosolutus amylolyticus]|uniref:Polysaccharide deacetylase family protein n=1 Tax=Halosolutus amylolyticus TaxID=2932267 RepID=A0ABD5PT84_9EURY|nr:polysaccharide deacetylase family protein [Halosolutus amylolyticus]